SISGTRTFAPFSRAGARVVVMSLVLLCLAVIECNAHCTLFTSIRQRISPLAARFLPPGGRNRPCRAPFSHQRPSVVAARGEALIQQGVQHASYDDRCRLAGFHPGGSRL